ncbi:MbtH family protein [Streptomyces odontomachi]|uniref:MbtH family protein n=1 Tax=Streptomyces odontomachi TaxID=2944940 RepID=UPI00210B8D99|nr:MbtH family protein [Streptomyces sp. ODS25]
MANPFDDDQGVFLVVVNEENQHSLWPNSHDIPAGWRRVFGPDKRKDCLEFVEENWTDLRPASLVAHAISAGKSM